MVYRNGLRIFESDRHANFLASALVLHAFVLLKKCRSCILQEINYSNNERKRAYFNYQEQIRAQESAVMPGMTRSETFEALSQVRKVKKRC